VRQLAPLLLFVAVTALLAAYGHTGSWAIGPLAAAALWALERRAREPAEPAPAHADVRPEPAPVD
jgi:hypothetical protein